MTTPFSLPGFTRRDFLKFLPIAGGALWLTRCASPAASALPTAAGSPTPAAPTETPSAAPTTPTATAPPAPSETFTPLPIAAEYLPPADGSYAFYPLPQPQLPAVSLQQALQERRSRRQFRADELPIHVIAALLWTGFGVNRPDGRRTAPSAYDVRDIDIYLATAKGLFRYNAPGHRLLPLLPDDLRLLTGTQTFVAAAPLGLVYVSDYSRMNASDEERLQWSWAHTGCIAQNVYLACAALGLAVVVRSTLDRAALAKRMNLNSSQHITLAQTIGYPA